jgi:peptidyl-tRNA hydrolase
MDFWKIRFREKWSAWWHNWIKHINKLIWEEYKRIKIWVWYNERYEMSDWVLSKFKAEETNKLDDIFSETMKKVWEAFE